MHATNPTGSSSNPRRQLIAVHPSFSTEADGCRRAVPSSLTPSSSSARRAGFRDCGAIALFYLTGIGHLSPDDPAVVGVRQIVERGGKNDEKGPKRRVRLNPVGRKRTAIEERSRSHRRRREPEQENAATPGSVERVADAAKPSTSATGSGRLVLGVNQIQAAGISLHDVGYERLDREGVTSPSTDFTREHALASVSNTPVAAKHSQRSVDRFGVTRHGAGDEQESTCPEIDTVQECARQLDRLARRDSRVENILNELWDLMDEESNEYVEQ